VITEHFPKIEFLIKKSRRLGSLVAVDFNPRISEIFIFHPFHGLKPVATREAEPTAL
jgi:hypothetical protein